MVSQMIADAFHNLLYYSGKIISEQVIDLSSYTFNFNKPYNLDLNRLILEYSINDVYDFDEYSLKEFITNDLYPLYGFDIELPNRNEVAFMLNLIYTNSERISYSNNKADARYVIADIDWLNEYVARISLIQSDDW